MAAKRAGQQHAGPRPGQGSACVQHSVKEGFSQRHTGTADCRRLPWRTQHTPALTGTRPPLTGSCSSSGPGSGPSSGPSAACGCACLSASSRSSSSVFCCSAAVKVSGPLVPPPPPPAAADACAPVVLKQAAPRVSGSTSCETGAQAAARGRVASGAPRRAAARRLDAAMVGSEAQDEKRQCRMRRGGGAKFRPSAGGSGQGCLLDLSISTAPFCDANLGGAPVPRPTSLLQGQVITSQLN